MPKVNKPRVHSRSHSRCINPIVYYRPTASDNLNYTYCYIFYGTTYQGKKTSYIGKTPNPWKRYEEHYGLRSQKGAVRTKRMKEKEMVFLLGGHPTERHALQCEWRLKHITSITKHDKPRSFRDRIYKIGQWLKSPNRTWTQSGSYLIGEYSLDLWIKKEFYLYLDISPEEKSKYPYLCIHVVDEITPSLLQRISNQVVEPLQSK